MWTFGFILTILINFSNVVPIFVNTSLKNAEEIIYSKYLNYDELTQYLQDLELKYPNLASVQSIGKSTQNRDLWVLQISENVKERKIGEPMFKYVANMHGDEVLGRQLMIILATYLLNNYGKDQRITQLVNETDIFLMPSLNPDGYEASKEGTCDSLLDYSGRENANHVDLNRDFPDHFDDVPGEDISEGRQNETLAMMTWIVANPFVLSGNLHSGAVVASYPLDSLGNGTDHGIDSITPDNELFKFLALTYARLHPVMKDGNGCVNETFPNGITNGANWYSVRGGMQDFNYFHSSCLEVTFELSCCKYPNASNIQHEWMNNKESLLSYMELIHMGVKGLVLDESKNAIEGAEIVVEGIDHNVTSTSNGEYWRMLLPGSYNIKAVCPGYSVTETKTVTVKNGYPVVLNFTLRSLLQEGTTID